MSAFLYENGELITVSKSNPLPVSAPDGLEVSGCLISFVKNYQFMTNDIKQPETLQPTEPGMAYDRVLPAGVSLRVLVACEYSGTVREAFKELGHYAMSCDLLDTEIPGEHYKGDVRDILFDGWDIMIAHPPCTHLAVSGARWFKDKQREQAEALEFVGLLMNAPIPRIAIENPISIISSRIRKPDQIIQPWQFGHGETKSTCL